MDDNVARSSIRKALASSFQRDSSYQATTPFALDQLVDIYIHYVEHLARQGHASAEHAGRSWANLYDVLMTMDRLHVCPSVLLKHLRSLKSWSSFTLAAPPEITDNNEGGSSQLLSQWMKEDAPEPLPTYAPTYGPPLPAKHTYKQTPIFQPREHDPRRIRDILTVETRNVQENLRKLEYRCHQMDVHLLRRPTTEQDAEAEGTSFKEKGVVTFPVIHYERAWEEVSSNVAVATNSSAADAK